MEREKEIEEMAKDVCPYGYDEETCFDPHCNDRGCLALSKARDMYDNKGYRKIPDGSVVLTREEYNKLDKYIAEPFTNDVRANAIETMLKDFDDIGNKMSHIQMRDGVNLPQKVFANFAYDLGYRKFTSQTVVMSQEELASYIGKERLFAWETVKEQSRKETAREIYFDALKEFAPDARASGKTNFFVQLLLSIKRICNRHGANLPESVEVE